MIVAPRGVIVKGGKGSFGDVSHFVGDSFDQKDVIATFVGNRTPLIGIQVVEVFGMSEDMFVEDDTEDSIVVAFEEMNDA